MNSKRFFFEVLQVEQFCRVTSLINKPSPPPKKGYILFNMLRKLVAIIEFAFWCFELKQTMQGKRSKREKKIALKFNDLVAHLN